MKHKLVQETQQEHDLVQETQEQQECIQESQHEIFWCKKSRNSCCKNSNRKRGVVTILGIFGGVEVQFKIHVIKNLAGEGMDVLGEKQSQEETV